MPELGREPAQPRAHLCAQLLTCLPLCPLLLQVVPCRCQARGTPMPKAGQPFPVGLPCFVCKPCLCRAVFCCPGVVWGPVVLLPVNAISLSPVPPGCPQMQPGFWGAGSATAPRCPRRISPSGNTLVWFSSILFSFFYSALWPSSGLKYIHQFSIFLPRELMNVSVLTEPSPPALTREESGGMKKNLSCSSHVLQGAVGESGGLDCSI